MLTKKFQTKTQQIPWQDPLKIAHQIAENYSENWVFLYSANHSFTKNSYSYIALFEQDRFLGSNFASFESKIMQSDSRNKWFGGLCYELSEHFENLTPNQNSPIQLPAIFFSQFGLVLEFNHQCQTLKLKCLTPQLIEKFYSYIRLPQSSEANEPEIHFSEINSNFTDQSYIENITAIKNMIANGDFFQANLTRKFFGKFSRQLTALENFKIFAKLIKASPANYNFFSRIDNKFIVSSSPELFLKSHNKKIKTRPIKGSIHRGNNQNQDRFNKNYLKNSPKEQAENLMIVDLMRNDFARFCTAGSVKVRKLFNLSSYATIHHLSSEIHGTINRESTIFDAIRACFPPGSMTGAPKIKVMEILRKIENINRGIYSGAFGIVTPKSLNLAVVIRTIIIEDNKFEFQVGGGITFDSDPHLELQETYTKIKGIMLGIGLAKDQLDCISGEDLQNL